MMKKITLLLILLTVSLGYSQVLLEDFETPLPGGALTVKDGLTASVVDDPVVGPSNQVLQIISASSGAPWQQAELLFQGDLIDLTATKKATAEVYSLTAFNLLAKVVQSTGSGVDSATSDSHTGSGWETLTFDFNSPEDGTGVANDSYAQILFIPNWAGNDSGNNGTNDDFNDAIDATYYIDDIIRVAPAAPTCDDGIQNGDETGVDCGGSCDACPTLELIEDFETPLPGGALTSTDDLVASVVDDPVVGPSNQVLQIISASSGTPWQQAELLLQGDLINLTATKIATAEVYSLTAFNLLAKVVQSTGSGVDSATSDSHTGSGWETLTFDFSSPEDGTGVANDSYAQILFIPNWAGNDSGNNGTNDDFNDAIDATYYIDDIMGVPLTLSTGDLEITSFKVFPNPTQDSWTVKTNNQDISSIQVFDILGKNVLSITPNTNEAKIDGSSLKTGLYFAQIKTANGISSLKLIKQ